MKLKNDNSELKEEIVEIICRQVCASLGDEMVESIIQKYIQGPQDLQKEILFNAGREKERFNRIRMRINSK
jgi:septum formation topological specificity factor MinE